MTTTLGYESAFTGSQIDAAVRSILGGDGSTSLSDRTTAAEQSITALQTAIAQNGNAIEDLQTDIESLQGSFTVDTTPTIGSTNPVASGGVYDCLYYPADLYIYPEREATEELYGQPVAGSGYIKDTGERVTGGGWYSTRVKMTAGHTYQVTFQRRTNKTACRIFRVEYDAINDAYTWTQVDSQLKKSGTWTYTCLDDGNNYVLQLARAQDGEGIPNIFDISVTGECIKDRVSAISTDLDNTNAAVNAINSGLTAINDAVTAINQTLDDIGRQNHLDICVLGNSYSMDSFSYVPFILQAYGLTCNIHVYYRGSGSLNDLYSQWTSNTSTDTAEVGTSGQPRRHYHCDTRTMQGWEQATRLSAKSIVELQQWDYIVLTQQSQMALNAASFANIDNIVRLINTSQSGPYKLCWAVAYTRRGSSSDLPETSLQNQQSAVEANAFAGVFPIGTAVFDARQNPTLAALGDTGNLWVDGVHLQDGLPCYIAALAIVEKILRMEGCQKSVMNEQTRPTEEWCTSHNILDRQNGTSVGFNGTDDTTTLCHLAQKAAIIANNHPWEVIGV